MEKSILYDLLEGEVLEKLRETAEKEECENWIFISERDAFKALEAELDEKSKKLLVSYSLAIENRIDYVYRDINIKILNFGVKTGMELQKAFAGLPQ